MFCTNGIVFSVISQMSESSPGLAEQVT